MQWYIVFHDFKVNHFSFYNIKHIIWIKTFMFGPRYIKMTNAVNKNILTMQIAT